MDGGGWVSVQGDLIEQRQRQRILEPMERFLTIIIENVTEGIIAKARATGATSSSTRRPRR